MKFTYLYFELTHRCNQHCKHCFLDANINNKTEELTTDEIKSIIYNFKQQGGTFITLTGGEVFVRPDLFEILDYIEHLGISFQVATNALAMNDTRLEQLKHYKHLKYFFTSILGRTEEEHRYISMNGNLSKVLDTIEFFADTDVLVHVQLTLKEDYFNQIDAVLDQLAKYENVSFKVTPIVEIGIKTDQELVKELVLPKERYSVFNEQYNRLKAKYKDKLTPSNLVSKSEFLKEIKTYEENDLYSLGFGEVCLRPNGDISFSYDLFDPYTFGNAKDGFEVDSNKVKYYINELKEIDTIIVDSMANDETLDFYDRRSRLLDRRFNRR